MILFLDILAHSKDSPIGNVSYGKTYICNGGQTIEMGENVTIKFNQLALQPFSSANLSTTDGKWRIINKDNGYVVFLEIY